MPPTHSRRLHWKASFMMSRMFLLRRIPEADWRNGATANWRTTRRLLLLKLVNPQLRQLGVPGRASSIEGGRIDPTPLRPSTRIPVPGPGFFHASIPDLDGPRVAPKARGNRTCVCVVRGSVANTATCRFILRQSLWRWDQGSQEFIPSRLGQAFRSLIPSAGCPCHSAACTISPSRLLTLEM